MLSDEDKEIFNNLKDYMQNNINNGYHKFIYNDLDWDFKCIDCINAIDKVLKQSKEIEELKECERLSQRQLKKQKNDIETLKIEIEELKDESTMLKQIKLKLQEKNIPIETLIAEFERLEDIEDRKVQIEYNNVFNKGVKSVEDKIKAKKEFPITITKEDLEKRWKE